MRNTKQIQQFALTGLCCLFLTQEAFSQEEPVPPCKGLSVLRSLTNPRTRLNEFFVRDFTDGQESFSTSLLKPDGPVPANKQDEVRLRAWSCQYGSPSALDGNPATAWAEGVAGNGPGEMILITGAVDPVRKVEIWAGLGASDMLHRMNTRPKEVRVHVIRAAPTGAAQTGYNHENVSLVASRVVVLKDLNGFQPLPVPAFKKDVFKKDGNEWEYKYWLLIELVSFYPGSKYADTCLSEIRNVRE